MLTHYGLPTIESLFDADGGAIDTHYRELVPLLLKQILPADLFTDIEDQETFEDHAEQFRGLLPLFIYSEFKEPPFTSSFYLLNRYRQNAFKFYFEMISRWLVPGTRLNVVHFHSLDFRMPTVSGDIYTLSEVRIRLEDVEEVAQIKQNLPIIESELGLGVPSAYYARKILDIKGMSMDEKTAMIQEYIAFLSKRLPDDLDKDVFTEMQHVLVKCRDEFKAKRESRHMSRIICFHYLFRKRLYKDVQRHPGKRYLSFKLIRARLHEPDGIRNVLGVCVGLNFLSPTEVFEERHLLKAIQNYIPNVAPVEDSFFQNARGGEQICTLYLEVVKKDGSDFSLEDVKRLRRELPVDLKDRIEHLMHPIFMPRNEEEIMRHILSLSSQIKYLRDIPQVIISFDEQTHQHLTFTVILLRVLKSGDQPIQKMFREASTDLNYIHDRVKTVGYIRKRYVKEATVFRIKVSKHAFLRADHSIDLYRARSHVVDELNKVLGPVRDYNGGLISKQNELLGQVRGMLGERSKNNDLLLENLFYSLTPVIMRNVLEPQPLHELFVLLLNTLNSGFSRGERYSLRYQEGGKYLLAVVTSDSAETRNIIGRALAVLDIPSTDLASAGVTVYDTHCLGYIYRTQDPEKRRRLRDTLERTLAQMEDPIKR